MWYNEGNKIVVLGGACDTPNRLHLIRRCNVHTVPHHVLEGNPYTIYALIDPRYYTIRYIGITNDVYARFTQHLRCDGTNPEKDAWIMDMRADNVMLIMKTLEVVEGVELARERETFWIHHHRFLGSPLLNQQIPSIAPVPRQAIQPPLFKVRKPGSAKNGRKFKYDQVKELVLYRYRHKKWPGHLSSDMRSWYEFQYFTKPRRSDETSNPKKYASHVRAYERGQQWIAELTEGA